MGDNRLKLAEYTLGAGKLDEAEKMCREVLAEEPRSVDALVMLARIAERGARTEMAIQLYRKALKIDPSHDFALNELETLLYTSGRHREAVDVWKGQIAHAPEDSRAHRNLGMCYLALGMLKEAADCFSRALELQPDSSALYQRLGLAYQGLGDYGGAADAFRKAISLDAREPSLHIALAQTLVKLNDSEGAVYAFTRASELEPNSTRGNLQLAQAQIEGGRLKEAESQLKKIVTMDSRSVVAQVLLGEVLIQLGQAEEALPHLLEAIRLDPSHVPAYYHYIFSNQITEEQGALVANLAKAEGSTELTEGERIQLHYALGKAYEDLGYYERAMRNFDLANAKVRRDLSKDAGEFSAARYEDAFDFMVEHFSREFFDQFEPMGSLDELPLFIVGMMRSGTTLVEQLLAGHPQVGAGGDLKFWAQRSRTLNKMAAPPRRERLAEAADAYHELLRSLSPGKKRVTDQHPANCMYLGSIHMIFPKARIIHCRRNPIDTCLSIYTTPLRDPPDFAHSKGNIAFLYRQYLRLMEHWREVLPADRFLEIDYEDLVDDTEGVTRRMVEFAHLKWDERCLPARPLHRQSVDRWRRYEPWLGEFEGLLESVPSS
jgi:tetratricopeptide (TPR) repeat protein